MDKYEYNLKLEEIDKLVDQEDYQEAANLADTIDWRRVRNIRTLCLISEIYEAAGRLEDSKTLLLRAYRRSPVGRTVLYRLVEVTTALGQYDEALEYYSEYVQAAPHDNNRYILKYKIYKGRGSQIQELIAILEEYLGQEYTERWAYELATLYQQSGQIQKCLAACDDLVLWFHSGKYVRKALELKRRYAALTPKQQQIYEEQKQEADSYTEEPAEEEDDNILQNIEQPVPNTGGEFMAESIMAQTEREIANQVAAHKAEKDKKEEELAAAEQPSEREQIASTRIMPGRPRQSVPQQSQSASAQGQSAPARNQPAQGQNAQAQNQSAQAQGEFSAPQAEEIREPEDLQVEMAKSMRKIISGVVKRPEESEEDIPASVDSRPLNVSRIQMPEPVEQVAGQLSIDDVLLSMSDKGKRVTEVVLGEAGVGADAQPAADEAGQSSAASETAADGAGKDSDAVQAAVSRGDKDGATVQANAGRADKDGAGKDGAAAGTAEDRSAADSAASQAAAEAAEKLPQEEYDRIAQEITGKDAASYGMTDAAADELTEQQREALRYTNHPEKLLRNRSALPTYMEDDDLGKTRRIASRKEIAEAAEKEILLEKTIRIPTEQISQRLEEASADAQQTGSAAGTPYEANGADGMPYGAGDANGTDEMPYEMNGAAQEAGSEYENAAYAGEEEYYDDEQEYEEYLTIPQHLRGLFSGFTEVEGLEDQIANAIIQAEAKGDDRTSRSGNILIFGAHGSGKTTLAMNIAKAIAQDKGSQTMKIAKIYATDLNRKDIAATVARIAGGTLIIEEAGDLEPGTVEQLTTAMEFRTDGLIVILEDEQQYVHELLMRHPRFTMKFTAQIYIPEYTIEELAGFGQIYANAQDYTIGDEGYETLCQKLEEAAQGENPVTLIDVIDIVGKAISRSNKFFRKLSMGKKRYDADDYIVLFPKDFK